MLYIITNLAVSLVVFLPVLLGVAYLTVLERKVIGVIQRRISVNIVGPFGLLQPFADALKLLAKENLIPAHANKLIFYAAPVVVLFFSLIGWLVIPFQRNASSSLIDIFISTPYSLAVSSIAVYGILLAGWAANSKYAFIGSIRSTAQLISYELIFSTSVLIVVLIAGTFSYTTIILEQQLVNFILPLMPLFVIYYISCLAETNRAPFDNVEAESELVAGFFAEHSSVPFVMFFLGEYNALLLISAITTVLFVGSYPVSICVALVAMTFVWVRATLPRFRFDTLLIFCWMKLLPVIVALLLLELSLLIAL